MCHTSFLYEKIILTFSILKIIFCVFLVHPKGINPVGIGRKLFCEGIYALWVLIQLVWASPF
jgi:hypothetical protein